MIPRKTREEAIVVIQTRYGHGSDSSKIAEVKIMGIG